MPAVARLGPSQRRAPPSTSLAPPPQVSFHTFKHPSWLREFHTCALYHADGAPRCFLPAVSTLLGGGCADDGRLSAAACAAAGARLPLPRLAAAADGAADAAAGACPALGTCELCVAHEPLPPPHDRGVRCVWCPTLGSCRAYTKGTNNWPCPQATRPGGGYPGGASCKRW